MRILYVLKHDPWGIGGGCYACRNYLDAFTDIFVDAQFDILYCREFGKIIQKESERWHFISIPPMSKLAKIKSIFTGVMDRFHFKVLELLKINKYDYCIFDHSSIAGSLAKKINKTNAKTIVLNHNFEYDYYRDSHPQWYKRVLVLPLVKRNERRSYLNCDCNIFLTKEDATLFKQIYGRSFTKIIIGGCFEQKQEIKIQNHQFGFNKRVSVTNKLRIVISGTLGNIQNMDGIDYFLNELYPLLPKSEIDIVITGKNPPRSLIDRIKNGADEKMTTPVNDIYEAYLNTDRQPITNGNLSLIPNPEDIQSVVAECDVYFCPMRLGGGMKLRMLDGLRNGLPIVCHQSSARGYSDFVEAGVCLTYHDKNSFMKTIDKILAIFHQGLLDKEAVVKFYDEKMSYINCVNKLQICLN